MLATFASILPSGITFSSNNSKADTDKERDRREPTQLEIGSASANSAAQQSQGQIDGLPIDNSTPLSEQNGNKSKEMSNMSELGVKKKRERSANETFIVVRPPPSVSNHPLNLQLQLVPPQSKDRPMSRRSVDYASDVASIASTSASVARTGSVRSNRSDVSSFYSSSASMTSVSSFASSASSSGSGRRMIIPLYNLSAHNVMTNTVLDAGTDAKVAKFNKRGMEIIGLAVLEPLEVWNSGGVGGTGLSHASNGLLRVGSKDTADGAHAHFDDSAHTPTSSALSLSSAGIGDNTVSHYQNTPLPPIPPEPSLTPTQSGAKKLFGRIFKKRDSDAQQQSASSSSSRTESLPLPVPISPLTKRSFATSRQPPASPTPSSDSRQGVGSSKLMSSVPSTPTQPVLRPPMLGIQSTVISPVYPPVGRPTRYVWVVRKWLKGNEGGLLGNVNNGLNAVMKGMRGLGVGEKSGNAGNGSAYEVGEGVEVRFEWARGTAKHTKRSSTIPPPPPLASASSNNRRSSVHGSQEHALPPLPPEFPERRLSAIRPGTADSSRRAPSPLAPKSREIGGHGGHVSIVQPNEHERDRESINVSVEESEEGTWDGHTPTRPTSTREKRSSLRASREDDDGGDESDPEDSETPWSCTLTVHSLRGRVDVERERERELLSLSYGGSSRTKAVGTGITPTPTSSHFSATSGTSSRLSSSSTHAHGPQPLLKIKIATLSPAPHHPKVVAQLKVPFPLPDVLVDRAKARKRVIGPNGIPIMRVSSRHEREEDVEDGGSFEYGGGGGGSGGGSGESVKRGSMGAEGSGGGTRYDGLMLTAEEIKDVLSSTAFWLVVREGLGGVGKVSRKGDGWRIRG